MDTFKNVTEAVEFLMERYKGDYAKALKWIQKQSHKIVKKTMKALAACRYREVDYRFVAAANEECEFWIDVQNELLDEEES